MSLGRRRLGDGPELVLMHGWGMNAAVWEPLLPDLAGRTRLTLIELPGHGASPPAAGPDLADWADRCRAAAPPRAHWLGWSLGGLVAVQAALDDPSRVSGLTLLAATPRFVQGPGWGCAMPLASLRQFADALDGDPHATLLRFLGLQVRGADHARATLRLLRAELQARPPASVEGLRQGLELLLHSDLRDALGRLHCPQHWLLGARDTLVPAALGDWLERHLDSAQVTRVPGAGHAPFLSHPQAVLAALVPERVAG